MYHNWVHINPVFEYVTNKTQLETLLLNYDFKLKQIYEKDKIDNYFDCFSLLVFQKI